MELLPGSLPDLLRQIRPFTLPMSCMRKLAIQLLTSLSFLSSQGVIHADIRPENVSLPLPTLQTHCPLLIWVTLPFHAAKIRPRDTSPLRRSGGVSLRSGGVSGGQGNCHKRGPDVLYLRCMSILHPESPQEGAPAPPPGRRACRVLGKNTGKKIPTRVFDHLPSDSCSPRLSSSALLTCDLQLGAAARGFVLEARGRCRAVAESEAVRLWKFVPGLREWRLSRRLRTADSVLSCA
jgi:serine/threonine protein kinase